MAGARRGQTLWDAWNDPESGDELQVAMDLLAIVRRDRAFSREVVRAFGMTRPSQTGPARQRTAKRRSGRRN